MIFKQNIIANKIWSHAGSAGISTTGLVAKLRNLVKIEAPVGYQDETGFHYGVKATGKQTNLTSAC